MSPFLFVILMSVIIKDSVDLLGSEGKAKYSNGSLEAVLYADDTLLMSASSACLQELLDRVAEVGARYGMELHWSKFQLLQVNGEFKLRAPGGDDIPPKDMMTYLGATIYADGSLKRELNQKLGLAWADFCKLDRLWKHATLSTCRKIKILQAVVVTKLLYGLSSAWLNASEIRRLNGFYCRCLRVILRIKPAYISRVSNAEVVRQSSQRQLSRQLLEQQMLQYGKVARSPGQDVLRRLAFTPGSSQPAVARFVRRVGRPRNEWVAMLQREAWNMHPRADQLVHNEVSWRKAVHEYCC
jgi:hypothetical protein